MSVKILTALYEPPMKLCLVVDFKDFILETNKFFRLHVGLIHITVDIYCRIVNYGHPLKRTQLTDTQNVGN